MRFTDMYSCTLEPCATVQLYGWTLIPYMRLKLTVPLMLTLPLMLTSHALPYNYLDYLYIYSSSWTPLGNIIYPASSNRALIFKLF